MKRENEKKSTDTDIKIGRDSLLERERETIICDRAFNLLMSRREKSAALIQFFSLSLVFRAQRCSSSSSHSRVISISFSIDFCFSLHLPNKNPYRPRIIWNILLLVLLFVLAAAAAVVTISTSRSFQIIFIVNLFIHLIRHFFI